MVKKDVTKRKKAVRSIARLTTLDDFLGEEGNREEFEAIVVKEVLAWQIEQAMKENNISRKQSGPEHEDLAQSDRAPARPEGRQRHADNASARRAHGGAVIAAGAGLRSVTATGALNELSNTGISCSVTVCAL
ncbi:hypothetical protein ABIC09_006266 [Bradyrhizobium sp. S3.12.5]|uniref:hypothetical protein n=1 Tax=Bradyrhizobium sp. S3.12.5 TaxID=3156386 RepID=UPI0033974107